MHDTQSAGSDISGKKKIFSIEILVLCIVAALCNLCVSFLVSDVARLPLYLDTVFIIAVCFSAGLLPVFFTCVLFETFGHLFCDFLLGYEYTLLIPHIFTLCSLTESVLCFLFHKRFAHRETAFLAKPSLPAFSGIAASLLVLVAVDCIAVSIVGGIIDTVLTALSAPRGFYPEDTFKLGLLRSNMPHLASAILSRIPINIVDRFIAVFAGYGLSVLYRKVRRNLLPWAV